MSSSLGNCIQCPECGQQNGYICKLDGDFFTTGEYAKTLEEFQIHGVNFNQKVDSVKSQLDYDTIQILKALFADNDCPNGIDYLICLQICKTLNLIQSRLSNDNKIDSIPGDDH